MSVSGDARGGALHVLRRPHRPHGHGQVAGDDDDDDDDSTIDIHLHRTPLWFTMIHSYTL